MYSLQKLNETKVVFRPKVKQTSLFKCSKLAENIRLQKETCIVRGYIKNGRAVIECNASGEIG